MILGPHTITRLRAQVVIDPYSGTDDRLDWDSPDELTVGGCSVQPAAAQPILRDMREGVVVDLLVWAPLDSDITERDRVRYDGEDYAVSDTIQRWEFAGLGHLVIPLQRVEG